MKSSSSRKRDLNWKIPVLNGLDFRGGRSNEDRTVILIYKKFDDGCTASGYWADSAKHGAQLLTLGGSVVGKINPTVGG
jgi:hypothetical protein